MEIVMEAPTYEVESGLYLEYGKVYLVRSVSFSKPAGVYFSLVGFTYGESHKEHYRFPASHFRALNGKQADVVRARAGTKAFDLYGNKPLYLIDFVLVKGTEKVRCQRSDATSPTKPSLLPYDMFEHV